MRVTSHVLRRDGSVAWIGRTFRKIGETPCGPDYTRDELVAEHEVHAFPAGGDDRVLDRGSGIARRSLALSAERTADLLDEGRHAGRRPTRLSAAPS